MASGTSQMNRMACCREMLLVPLFMRVAEKAESVSDTANRE